jgi:molybdopterin synthase catalytic subunit
MHDVSIQSEDFDVGREIARLSTNDDGAGAIASFVGQVRGGEVKAITLAHYPGVTERALAAIVDEAHMRWHLRRVRVIHRVGHLLPRDNIVFVGVSSSHRGDAFAACAFIMDYLKTRVPVWKEEALDQCARRVRAMEPDKAAASCWSET